jgi:hypothetical protein
MKASDRAQMLRARVVEISSAREHEKDAHALEDKRKSLEKYRDALRSAVDSAAVLVRNRCLEPPTLPDPNVLIDALTKITEAFASDSAAITKGRNFTQLCKYLEALIDQLADSTKSAWKQEVSSAPKTNDNLLSKISKLPGKARAVEELRTANTQLADATKRAPTNQEEWALYQELSESVGKKVELLSADNFPKPVLDFCIASQSSEGARLSMLTDDVRDWLDEHGMLDDVRYRL